MNNDNKTMKFQPGDTVVAALFGKVVACSVSTDLAGRVRKQVRVRYGTDIHPRFLVADENELHLAGHPPRVTSVKVGKEGEKPVEVPFTSAPVTVTAIIECPECKWTGTVDSTARATFGNIFPVGDCPECGAPARLVKAAEINSGELR